MYDGVGTAKNIKKYNEYVHKWVWQRVWTFLQVFVVIPNSIEISIFSFLSMDFQLFHSECFS